MIIIKLVQIGLYKWNLVSPTGHVMVEDKQATTVKEAVDWAKAYISSHPHWMLDVVTMEKK